MIPERIAEHISMAETAQDWLRARNSRVTDVRLFMRRPLIEITSPPVELITRAERVNEHCMGRSRVLWTASLQGCQIVWR